MDLPDFTQGISAEERQLNLLLTLLAARHPLRSKDIALQVYGYDQTLSPQGLDYLFRKDREALEKLGIRFLKTGQNGDHDVAFTVDLAATRDNPDLRFTPAEAAWLNLAYQLENSQHSATRYALLALTNADREVNCSQGEKDHLGSAREQHFLPKLVENAISDRRLGILSLAIQKHQMVSFSYRNATARAEKERTLQPWGLFEQQGKVYLWGKEEHRSARTYKLDRMGPQIKLLSDSFTLPSRMELPLLLQPRQAVVAIRPGKLNELRNLSTPVAAEQIPDLTEVCQSSPPSTPSAGQCAQAPAGWDVFVVNELNSFELINRLVQGLDHLVVLGPEDIRCAVFSHLQSLSDLNLGKEKGSGNDSDQN